MTNSSIKFTFKPVECKHKVKKNINKPIKAYCICIEENNKFSAEVSILENNKYKTYKIPFTDNSYSLKGKTIIFSKSKDKYGHITRIHRSIEQAIHSPGLDTQYTPFRDKWIYLGNIVIINDKKYFDVTETIGHINDYKYLIDK